MIELQGDLFTFHHLGPIVITTNGAVRHDGACIMGRGVAQQAVKRWPQLPYDLGARIRVLGNIVHYFGIYDVFTFPVKHHWSEPADLSLIDQSARQLKHILLSCSNVYLPRPGCANGCRDWETEVKPILQRVFGDDPRFIIVNNGR